MKIDLSKIKLGMSALSGKIYVGIIDKDNVSFLHKKDVTDDFIEIINWYAEHRENIHDNNGNKYKIIKGV